jgi:ABC-type uncharacterized transport system substrate-binding protein
VPAGLRTVGLLVGLALLAIPLQALAHPHVWISVTAAFTLDAEGRLASVRQSWSFDEMYSSYAVFGLDRDGDGRYSADELFELTNEFASDYRGDRFFSKASLEGAEVGLAEADDLDLQVTPQGALVLSFTQRFLAPVAVAGATFRLQVRDPSVFIDFTFPVEGYASVEPRTAACTVGRENGQPPKSADPETLMQALINGSAQVATRAVALSCKR